MDRFDGGHLRQGALRPPDAKRAEREHDVMAVVEGALDAGRAALAYQPIVSSGDWEKVIFHEALIRLFAPCGRMIPAAEFIEEVETTDLGRRIDVLALEIALDGLQRTPDLSLAVNMSACSIGCPDWMKALELSLAKDPSIAARLIVEVTESAAIVCPDQLRAVMTRYQAAGVRFALDDFGSGYTSMRYLKTLCFDILKIDGEFTRDIKEAPDNRALVQAMVAIAHHFDMITVAEMVETAEEAQELFDLGVRQLQGYFFGAPRLWGETRSNAAKQNRA